MTETRRKFDRDFQQGAVRLVFETEKPIAQVARELGINEGTLGNWVARERRRRDGAGRPLSEDERAELIALRKENAELRMQRDVLKRSVALWVNEAMGGSGGRVHRHPEGRAQDSARGRLPGARRLCGLVLQVAPR